MRWRRKWGVSTAIAKIDVAKTYDTLEHAAIHKSFERRGMPAPFQAAYWRCHTDRTRHFSSTDGGGAFSAVPTRGVPQGSPESATVYAAVIEDVIADVEEELRMSRRRKEIPLTTDVTARAVDKAKNINTAFSLSSFAYINFAGDTYIFGRREDQVSFSASVLARRLSRADQLISAEKAEFVSAGTSRRFDVG